MIMPIIPIIHIQTRLLRVVTRQCIIFRYHQQTEIAVFGGLAVGIATEEAMDAVQRFAFFPSLSVSFRGDIIFFSCACVSWLSNIRLLHIQEGIYS